MNVAGRDSIVGVRRLRRVWVVLCLGGVVACLASAGAGGFGGFATGGTFGTVEWEGGIAGTQLDVHLARTWASPLPLAWRVGSGLVPPGDDAVAVAPQAAPQANVLTAPGLAPARPQADPQALFHLTLVRGLEPTQTIAGFTAEHAARSAVPASWAGQPLVVQRHITFASIGLPLVAALLAVPAIAAGLRRLRHDPRPGCCVGCGYDLRATPDACPECGRRADTPTRSRPRRAWPAAGAVVLTAIVVGNVVAGSGDATWFEANLAGRDVALGRVDGRVVAGVASYPPRVYRANLAARAGDGTGWGGMGPAATATVPAWLLMAALVLACGLLVRRLRRPRGGTAGP